MRKETGDWQAASCKVMGVGREKNMEGEGQMEKKAEKKSWRQKRDGEEKTEPEEEKEDEAPLGQS